MLKFKETKLEQDMAALGREAAREAFEDHDTLDEVQRSGAFRAWEYLGQMLERLGADPVLPEHLRLFTQAYRDELHAIACAR